ncbi:hypothetical protein [Pedobacter sp. MW01-1-1]|uniref:hypothetical protein n=1 Tax=Pedobacter sp. MW01-1-1 TaxID=3383027 RepID=UPI003FED7F9F
MSDQTQLYEWNATTGTDIGERVIAYINATAIDSYTAAEFVGQIIDADSNWGNAIPYVANFKVMLQFSGGFVGKIEQDVVTPNITLRIKTMTASQMAIVAYLPRPYKNVRVFIRYSTGYNPTISMGNPYSVTTSGTVLVAQPTYKTVLVSNASGNYGIGINEPTLGRLQVEGNMVAHIGNDQNAFVGRNTQNLDKYFYNVFTSTNGDGILWLYNSNQLNAISLNSNGSSWLNGGNVGVGTTNPSEKLTVNGKIKAKELKIEPSSWSDYVFDKEYKIMSLLDLEKYIKLNRHLPEVPNAKEVEANGIEVGEMNKLLLKKIEELTLHLIEKDKELKRERECINEQNKRIENIESLQVKLEAKMLKLLKKK